MAKIVCSECGTTGDSKCPYCRSVFPDRDTLIQEIDARVGNRMKIGDDAVTVKFWPNGVRKETALDALQFMWDVMHSGITREDLRVLACAHRWEFAPGVKSDIGCGH